jgi:hypothetical protein
MFFTVLMASDRRGECRPIHSYDLCFTSLNP